LDGLSLLQEVAGARQRCDLSCLTAVSRSMMLLVKSHHDFTVSAADGRSIAKGVFKDLRTETDAVDDQVELIGRDGPSYLVLHLTEKPLGRFNSCFRQRAQMQSNLAGNDSRKEIPAHEWQEHERRRHDGNSGNQREFPMMQNRPQRMGVTVLDTGISLKRSLMRPRIDRLMSSLLVGRTRHRSFISGRLQWHVHFHSYDIRCIDSSAHKVTLGEVDHFVAAPAQYSANHVEAEAQGLFKTDGRRHR
jgi:hypothetical protein